MIKGVINRFKPAPFIEPIEDEQEIKQQYKYWRTRTFYTMFIGYAFYYFSRKSFIFAMPAMISELGFTKSDLGILGSVLSISYGISKFTSGIIGDRSNPRYLMSFGLILTGIINIAFGFSSTILAFAILWALNGYFQGYGWPPACRLLTHWYAKKERGTWWSLWSTSHNVGGALIPLVAAYCAQRWGWRYAMYVPGVICIFAGFFIFNRLRDIPQSLGLPPIEKFKNGEPAPVKGQKVEAEHELTVKEILFEYVLFNKFIWFLAFSYFFVYIVRTAVNDWSQLFLVETKSYKQVSAGFVVSWFEIGGFFGMLVAGWASDHIFKGRRVPVMIIYMIGILIPFSCYWLMPVTTPMLDTILMATIGFCIFGPQMLVGCCAADVTHKKAAGTATGFVGCFAYIGAAVAGYPLGGVIEKFGWEGYFVLMLVCSLITILLLMPMVVISDKKAVKKAMEAA